MHVDTNKLDGEYPPEPECQLNSSECSFKPVHSLCHECGRKLCEECAVGIRHQPQIFKYVHSAGESNDRVQYHCSDCARSHEYNTTILGAGAGGIVLGILILGLLGSWSFVFVLLGLVSLLAGGYLLYNEYTLKTDLDASDLGA